jgi:hypothetical protein
LADATQMRISLAALLAAPSSPAGMSLAPSIRSSTWGRVALNAEKKRFRDWTTFSPPKP